MLARNQEKPNSCPGLALPCLAGNGLALAIDGAEVVPLVLLAPCLYWKDGATGYQPALQPATPRE